MNNSNYLKDLPQSLEEKGLCKTFFVRRETIHLKHILTVLLDASVKCPKPELHGYMSHYLRLLRQLYKIDRNYMHSIENIIKVDKGKFFEYIKIFRPLKPTIYIDHTIHYGLHQKLLNTIATEFHLQLATLNDMRDSIKPNVFGSPYSFVISNDENLLRDLWWYNVKTYTYKNKQIKNFTLYDK